MWCPGGMTSDRPSLAAVLIVAVITLLIATALIGTVAVRRVIARDAALDRAAISQHHAAPDHEREAAFQLAPLDWQTAPSLWPVLVGPPTFLDAMLSVTDEMARCRTAVAADLAALRRISDAASQRAQQSADAMARALPVLAPTVWSAFDSAHRPTGCPDEQFADILDLQSWLYIEATIHAPHPQPMSALSDSQVGVDWDAELKVLLIQEVRA
jgi:hypothetical protein